MSHHSVRACAEGGFVRFPRSYLHLPISPGAKVVLMHLCGAANDDGESWYSYEDIGDMVQRSKASVTSYVAELVEAGLIIVFKQTMANGYNYRNKLKVIGWRDLVAFWAEKTRNARKAAYATRPGPARTTEISEPHTRKADTAADKPDTKTECSVQDSECSDPTGPKINHHQTKTPPPAAPRMDWTDKDEQAWRRFRPSDKDPISSHFGPLPPDLAEKVIATARDLAARCPILSAESARQSARQRLQAFAIRKRIPADSETLDAAAQALAGIADTASAQDAVIAALETAWQPHWKRLSSPYHIKALANVARSAEGAPDDALRRMMGCFRMRAFIASRHLGRQAA